MCVYWINRLRGRGEGGGFLERGMGNVFPKTMSFPRDLALTSWVLKLRVGEKKDRFFFFVLSFCSKQLGVTSLYCAVFPSVTQLTYINTHTLVPSQLAASYCHSCLCNYSVLQYKRTNMSNILADFLYSSIVNLLTASLIIAVTSNKFFVLIFYYFLGTENYPRISAVISCLAVCWLRLHN